MHAFGFPVWTFAVLITGPIWAHQAWSSYWNWDPKEVWAFITWVVYAAYLHARATAGWKGRNAAIVALVGLATLWFNFIGINFFSSTSQHSYAAPVSLPPTRARIHGGATVKEFAIYTGLRVLLFVASLITVMLIWSLFTEGQVPALWSVVIAFAVSGVLSYFLLNRQRDAFARRVEERACPRRLGVRGAQGPREDCSD